jgi:arsenite methyltransferase
MTEAQVRKAKRLKNDFGYDNVTIERGYLEDLPFEDGIFDLVISNGVINLSAEKSKVFHEIFRVLKSGGRLAISDIVTGIQLSENIVGNTDLWAACIGGAAHIDRYKNLISEAGLEIKTVQSNEAYQFISANARTAAETFKIESISLLAIKG